MTVSVIVCIFCFVRWDKEKESKINRLIEDDVKKLMELAAPDEENGYIFVIGTFLMK